MKYFLSSKHLAVVAPYVDSDSLKRPVINIDRKAKRGHLVWIPPSKEDIKTVIDMIGMETEDIAPIAGLTNRTLQSYQLMKSNHKMKYSGYSRLCKLAAMKVLGEKLPTPGGWIYSKPEREILSEFVPAKNLRYPVISECNRNDNGTIDWIGRPSIEEVAFIIDKILEYGYITQDLMPVMGINLRAVRKKKTIENIELNQFISLCNVILKINAGEPDFYKPKMINDNGDIVDRTGLPLKQNID